MIVILQNLRNGSKEQAIYNLRNNTLDRSPCGACMTTNNSYLAALTRRIDERVELDSLAQTRDYFAEFPHPEWGTNTVETAINEVLRLAGKEARENRSELAGSAAHESAKDRKTASCPFAFFALSAVT